MSQMKKNNKNQRALTWDFDILKQSSYTLKEMNTTQQEKEMLNAHSIFACKENEEDLELQYQLFMY